MKNVDTGSWLQTTSFTFNCVGICGTLNYNFQFFPSLPCEKHPPSP